MSAQFVEAGAAFDALTRLAPAPFNMIVYTYYNSDADAPREQARFIRLWSESWRKWGWIPLLLTDRMADEHLQSRRKFRRLTRSMFATLHYNKPGLLVPANVINFGLKPKRLAAGGVMFYPGCVVISKDTLRTMKKERVAVTKLDYRYDICVDYIVPCSIPLLRFSEWDSEDVMEVLRQRAH